jgi:hypothetical protein
MKSQRVEAPIELVTAFVVLEQGRELSRLTLKEIHDLLWTQSDLRSNA